MQEQVEHALRYHFTSPELLIQAMTHSSAANELAGHKEHNERLEFLGDAVLELCVSHELYNRFPSAREGQLTNMRSKMVNQSVLARLARDIGLETMIFLGKGEEAQGGRKRDSLLSDAFEALLGAVFVDGGVKAAAQVVVHLFANYWPDPDMERQVKDAKSKLQECVQQHFKALPQYSLVQCSGPEHAREFVVRLTLPDGATFTASGSSMKRAEQQAASMALSTIQQVLQQQREQS